MKRNFLVVAIAAFAGAMIFARDGLKARDSKPRKITPEQLSTIAPGHWVTVRGHVVEPIYTLMGGVSAFGLEEAGLGVAVAATPEQVPALADSTLLRPMQGFGGDGLPLEQTPSETARAFLEDEHTFTGMLIQSKDGETITVDGSQAPSNLGWWDSCGDKEECAVYPRVLIVGAEPPGRGTPLLLAGALLALAIGCAVAFYRKR